MKKVLSILAVLLLWGEVVFAQTTPVTISEILSHLTAHEAVGFDLHSKNAVSYTSFDLVDWKMLSLSAGYTTSSGVVGSLDVDLGGVSQFGITSPLLSIIDLRVGFMVGMGDMSTASSSGTAERNKLIYGPEVTIIKVNW
jgi:hypothetical protein